ncbi:MAG: histidine kinase dimerization/phospho-acceptor domain-containing protein [Burkholderiales bacterium]
MTHEMRMPMMIIMGYTEMSLINTTDPDQIENLGKVEQAAEQLLLLINNLVDITAVEAK